MLFEANPDVIVAFSACPQDTLPINGATRAPTEAHFPDSRQISPSGRSSMALFAADGTEQPGYQRTDPKNHRIDIVMGHTVPILMLRREVSVRYM